MFKPRPGQAEVLQYTAGKMGISAVPGSGKTHTLSYLAARLVANEDLDDDQEILIVTLVNSAVDNFAGRVAGFLREMELMPGIGYRVRTLHGLAYDIVREHPSLAGLDNQFSIADERTSAETLKTSVSNWMRTHPDLILEYSDSNYPPEKNTYQWTESLTSLAGNFIKQAKDYQITPDLLHQKMDEYHEADALLNFGYQIYADYQRALTIRGAVDFEDLIRLAYKLLSNNPDYLSRLQRRWPIILEDEAQDSSLIQEKLLRLLCGENGNWVRVGDPNQAIFETFTTADPKLLREFIQEDEVVAVDLKHSGRSTASIMEFANQLVTWTQRSHPVPELREILSEPLIQPTPPGDAQPNPADEPEEIYLISKSYSAEDEVKAVAISVKKWVGDHPDLTVAVLVPRNARGTELVEELVRRKVPVKEMLNSSQETRDTARKLKDILNFFTHPSSTRHFTDALKAVLKTSDKINSSDLSLPEINQLIRQNQRNEEILNHPETFIKSISGHTINENAIGILKNAINKLKRWQRAILLPIDQMIMTIAMEQFTDPAELALAHKLAVILKSEAGLNPQWDLPDFVNELNEITKNRFRLYGFSEDDLEFNPEEHKGVVVVSTLHKAKGLEWDRVYLMSVNNYDYPSLQPHDQYISEKWFVRDGLNLEAEALAKLKAIAIRDKTGLGFPEGFAGEKARLDYCAERLRLFYVGITRARRQLIVTWNTGRRKDCTEAIPLQALRSWWEENHAAG
ncbi:MAG TPA: ATP-dependent helicase [Pelolinea sp.]|nr:ATP-dependent helicase [Pelolinea sp.]